MWDLNKAHGLGLMKKTTSAEALEAFNFENRHWCFSS
jgi:hypothetical protein